MRTRLLLGLLLPAAVLLLVGTAGSGGAEETRARVYLISGGPTPTSPAWRGRLAPYGTASSPERGVLALLRGPVVTDTGELLGSAAPKGTTLAGLEVTDGVATVRLSSPSAPQRWGRAGTYLTAQLVFTLTEFRSIDRVRVLVNGRPCCLHMHDGRRVTKPLDRAVFDGWADDFLSRRPSGARDGWPVGRDVRRDR